METLRKHGLIEQEHCTIHLDTVGLFVQNPKEFYKIYFQLLCEESKKFPKTVVFCPCCDSRKNFLRNFALISSGSKHPFNVITLTGSKMDPFLEFIKAKASKEAKLALEIVEQVPLFWEAQLLLIELSDSFIQIDSPLSPLFYAYLKILRDIDSPNIDSTLIKTDINKLPYSLSMLDKNTLAALNYCYGNDKKALKIFKTIDFTTYFDPTFFEFYGIMLYNLNDSSLPLLCENMLIFHKIRHETFIMVGLLHLSQGRYTEARSLFKKAYKINSSPEIACLVAYSYLKLQDYEGSASFYQQALRNNFRILYTVAQGYFSMNKFSICMSYCRKALEIREDGTIYKLMGRVQQSLENPDMAIKYFDHAIRLQEYDSLLYLAEIYKAQNETQKVLDLYERYLVVGEKNLQVVAKYLANYHEECGDLVKMEKYRSMEKRYQMDE